MGADLYRSTIHDRLRDQFKPAFDKAVSARDAARERLEPDGKNGWHKTPEYEAAQAKVEEAYSAMYTDESYFRDSYNDSSVMWRLGISWWGDVTPMLDEDGNLTPEKATELADRIEKTELKLLTQESLASGNFNPNDTVDDWNKWYIEQKAALLKFLRAAAEAGDNIRCSL